MSQMRTSRIRHHLTQSLLVLALATTKTAPTRAFLVEPSRTTFLAHPFAFSRTIALQRRAAPSKVEDPDGPTPVEDPPEIPEVDPETVEGLKEIHRVEDLHVAVEGQPWRRGDTAGCDAPISAEWRKQAEDVIKFAVDFVGETEIHSHIRYIRDRGTPIDVREPKMPMYYDPADPNPEPIQTDGTRVVYTRETPEQKADAEDRRRRMYATKDEDDDPNEDHIPDIGMDETPLYMNEETQEDFAGLVADTLSERAATDPQPFDIQSLHVDSAALSTVAQAILDALEPYEEEWDILSRHELMLTSPNPAPDVIETQKQFDAYRDHHVIVETHDPFESNRTLKGQLVDRNAMDLLLNIKGRLVTVPLNFVKCVRLPPNDYVLEEDEEEEDSDGEVIEAIPDALLP